MKRFLKLMNLAVVALTFWAVTPLRAQSFSAAVIPADQVPQAVRDAFGRDFPGMNPMKWEKHQGQGKAQANAQGQAANRTPRYVAVFEIASTEVAPATPTNAKGKPRKPRQVKTRSRARYMEDGTLIFQQVHHPGPVVPSTVSSTTVSANAGFRLDWATEIKNMKKSEHFFILRMSKASPKEVRKFYVKPDGSPMGDAAVPAEAKEIDDKD